MPIGRSVPCSRGCRNIRPRTNYNASRPFYEFSVSVLSFSHPFPLPFLIPSSLCNPSFLFSSRPWSTGRVPSQSPTNYVRYFLSVALFFSLIHSLSLAASLIKFVHVVDGIYLCVSSLIRAMALPPRKAYNEPVADGSSFATLGSSGA